jgi:hypothetical protein
MEGWRGEALEKEFG